MGKKKILKKQKQLKQIVCWRLKSSYFNQRENIATREFIA